MKMATVAALLVRSASDETTFAVVKAARTDALNSAKSLVGAITRAVTGWINETTEGKHAWDETNKDLNIGDLSSYIGDESLAPFLSREGLTDLTVDIHSYSNRSTRCTYDTVLVNHDELGDE